MPTHVYYAKRFLMSKNEYIDVKGVGIESR